jgi:hypothetical protein
MAIWPRPQVELEKTYNAAADHYDHPAVSFCDRYGAGLSARLKETLWTLQRYDKD